MKIRDKKQNKKLELSMKTLKQKINNQTIQFRPRNKSRLKYNFKKTGAQQLEYTLLNS